MPRIAPARRRAGRWHRGGAGGAGDRHRVGRGSGWTLSRRRRGAATRTNWRTPRHDVPLLPSALITITGRSPSSRLLTNAMWRPSGDQAAPKSSPGPNVSWVWWLPSARIEKMCPTPKSPSSYAIFRPSGLQSGSWSWSLASKVSWVLLDPFEDMTQTCSLTEVAVDVRVVGMDERDLPCRPASRPEVVEAAGAVPGATRQGREAAAGPRVDDVDLVMRVAALVAVEDDLPAVRAVVGERREAAEVGDGVLVAAELVHRPDLERAGAVAAERDVLAVGRVGGAGVEARVGGQPPEVLAVGQRRVDVVVAVGPGHREGEPSDVAGIGGRRRARPALPRAPGRRRS